MAVSFSKEVKSLRLGAGETFHGEGILADHQGAAAVRASSYVGGYQGRAGVAPARRDGAGASRTSTSWACTSRRAPTRPRRRAMLGASIHYPLRGAVTLEVDRRHQRRQPTRSSNLSSPGVVGGALIVVGEDYGEGASVIQERTHAYRAEVARC